MKLIKTTPKPPIQIEMSYEEAILLRSFVGKLNQDKVTSILNSYNSGGVIKYTETYNMTSDLYKILDEVN